MNLKGILKYYIEHLKLTNTYSFTIPIEIVDCLR